MGWVHWIGECRSIANGCAVTSCNCNDDESNDSDAESNNDPENPLKTRARFIHVPKLPRAGFNTLHVVNLVVKP